MNRTTFNPSSVALSPDEIARLTSTITSTGLPRSTRPLTGPALTMLRKFLWRLMGLNHAFCQKQQDLVTLLREMEVMRLGHCFQFREGTFDKGIFDAVAVHNEYNLPPRFRPSDIIIDIGMHIGSFCYAALLRGSRHVYGFEAEQDNYKMAVKNLQGFEGCAHLSHKAVWRSDRQGDALYHHGSSNANTGGGSILWPTSGEKLDVIALDDILREVTENGKRRVRFMKIDCEGSEYPILLTSRCLHWIDNIHGEYHEINNGTTNQCPIPAVAQVSGVERFTMAALANCLERAGFTVTSEHSGAFLGHFYATRQPQ